MRYRNLIIILGDQLSDTISSLENFDIKQDRILMMEVMKEASYTHHHKQKLTFIFSAMRHFAQNLNKKEMQVEYIELTSACSYPTFHETLKNYLKKRSFTQIIVTEPSEYRVLDEIKSQWKFDTQVIIKPDTRFYCSIDQFKEYANQHQSLRLEFFYRFMRKKTGILMVNNQPVGGKWNFDQQNREHYNKKIPIPEPMVFSNDRITKNVIKMVNKLFANNMGSLDSFNWAVTRQSALRQLNHFIDSCLPHFGRFQDAMAVDEYRLFHSLLSPYINVGLLTPREVIARVIDEYKQNNCIPISAAEGLIRQILGWREYVRGIYWLKMPQYKGNNYLDAYLPLPDFYWTGKTRMACMKQVIQQTIDMAHSHHIQRLMITGNFALLTGIDIAQICDWYLAVYIDAFEWVELPNTLGMVCYADEGLMASKPYAASGNYINKMSDFCKTCDYHVSKKIGSDACPFNALYWNFLLKNESKLSNNQRLKYPYLTLKRMTEEEKQALVDQAETFIKHISNN